MRALATLPSGNGFFDTLSTGIDYKHFDQNVELGSATDAAPITYYPITATYSASWQGNSATMTQADLGPTFNIRGFGSSPAAFIAKRTSGESNFIYLRGDLSRLQDIPLGFQIYARRRGSFPDEPLVNSEQFSLGGQDTAAATWNSRSWVMMRSPPP